MQLKIAVSFHFREYGVPSFDKMRSKKSAHISPPIQAEICFRKGLEHDRHGNFTQAIAHYQQAIALNPSYVEAYNNLGCAIFQVDQIDRAIHYFQQGLALDPSWSELHNNLAQAYVALDQPDEAIESYNRALQCQAELPWVHHNLGKLWHHQHDYERAVAYFQQAIQLSPGVVAFYSDCAQALFDWGKPTQAIPYLRRAIALQPQFIEGYCRGVEGRDIQDGLDQARHQCAIFLRLLQHNGTTAEILTAWAETYRYFGDVSFLYERYDQAGQYYGRSLQLRPSQPDLHERLGDCFAQMGQEASSVLYYHMALHHLELQDWSKTGMIHLKLAQILEESFPALAAEHYHHVCQTISRGEFTHLWSELYSGEAFHNPELLPLPNTVYQTTADWVASTALKSADYRPVAWGNGDGGNSLSNPPMVPHEGIYTPQCGGVSCGACMAQLCSQFQPTWVEEGVYQCTGRSHPVIDDPPAFVVTIPDGRAWIAPQQNSWMICNAIAIMTPDHALLGDLSRCYPWYLPGCTAHDFGHHRLFGQKNLPPVVHLKGTVAVLSCLAGHVYYHWLFDLLPRLELLRRSGIRLDEIDWFVVNNTNYPFQRETLARLGIPPEKIIASDEYSYIQAETLIVPSFPGHMDWVSMETLNWLRKEFLSWMPDGQSDNSRSHYPRRIYLSRAKASYRQVINEQELCDRLSSLGFVTVQAETLSVKEQVALFAQADTIVAPHGSGLANLAFCSPGTRVIELFAPEYVRTDYWIISQRLHLDHYYVIGETFDCEVLRRIMNPNPLTENICVSSAAIEGMLNLLSQ